MKTKISISQCNEYQLDKVTNAIKEALEPFGGISHFVKENDTVLLKPNMLIALPPEDNATTHPVIVEAVAKLVLSAGATPIIGDSPGGSYVNLNRFYKATGFKDVAERLNIELANFEAEKSVIFEKNGYEYPIAKIVHDVDVVINLPKIKSHGLTLFSCAIKNLYGTVPGFRKVEFHKESPRPTDFANRIVDVFTCSRTTVNIVDGIIGMDGMGPSGGNPNNLGMILVSDDSVALDRWLSAYLGKNPDRVLVNRVAKERGLGETDFNNMEIIGNPPKLDGFNWPFNIYGLVDSLPNNLMKSLLKIWWVRPAINKEDCRNCNICVNSCPVSTINKGDGCPSINYDDCINCLCCMEVCPEKAMFQDTSKIYALSYKIWELVTYKKS